MSECFETYAKMGFILFFVEFYCTKKSLKHSYICSLDCLEHLLNLFGKTSNEPQKGLCYACEYPAGILLLLFLYISNVFYLLLTSFFSYNFSPAYIAIL